MGSDFKKWIGSHLTQIRENPARGIMHAVFTIYLGLWYTVTSRWPAGTNIFDEHWDLLIILDGCRVDVLEEVAVEYDFIESIESRWSVGSHSHEWLTQTFSEEYLEQIMDTAYVTGNGHTHETFVEGKYPPDETVPFCWTNWRAVDTQDFGELAMLWETAHRDGLGVPPRAITDQTVAVSRHGEFDNVIAHYMQPHIPYIANAVEGDRAPTEVEKGGWKLLETGDADCGEVWRLYRDNLRLVLDEVELLLENIDAETVVITADHGNAFGEYSIYGHPEGMLLPCIKKIPWVTTSSKDEETFEPTGEYANDSAEKTDIQEHLRDLGYV